MKRIKALIVSLIAAQTLATGQAQAAPAAGTSAPKGDGKPVLADFDNKIWNEITKAYRLRESQPKVGASMLAKLNISNPGIPYLHFAFGRYLFYSTESQQSIVEIERAITLSEAKGEHVRRFYDELNFEYAYFKRYRKTEELTRKMMVLFPKSKDQLTRTLAMLKRQVTKQNGHMERPGTATADRVSTAASLADLKGEKASALPPGWAYVFTARTVEIPRFKCLVTPSQAMGDSGVAQFLVVPPAYDVITLLQPESHNYLSGTLRKLAPELEFGLSYNPRYEKITRLKDIQICGMTCAQYKCQLEQDSTYDLAALAWTIPIKKELANATADICSAPHANCLILNLCTVIGGFVEPRVQTDTMKKEKYNPSIFTVPSNYHRVKNMGEFVYSFDGEMKQGDVDMFLRSH